MSKEKAEQIARDCDHGKHEFTFACSSSWSHHGGGNVIEFSCANHCGVRMIFSFLDKNAGEPDVKLTISVRKP